METLDVSDFGHNCRSQHRAAAVHSRQFLRDYLLSIGWNQKPPAPPLPPEIVDQTAHKYARAYDRLKKVLAE